MEERLFEHITQQIAPGGRLLRHWELKGGVSAEVTALLIADASGAERKVVVRRHGLANLAANPNSAIDEYHLLKLLAAHGLAVPQAYLADDSGVYSAIPYLVVEFVDGMSDFAPANMDASISQMAQYLAGVHRISAHEADLSFLPDQAKKYARLIAERPDLLDESIDEGRIRAVLEAVAPLPQRNRPVLLHNDFWPGNVLWRDGQLVATIDWEDAMLGDPAADLANSRMELILNFDEAAMHSFTEHYRAASAADLTDLPYLDLYAALRPAFKFSAWAASAEDEQKLRAGHRRFTALAFAQIEDRGK